MRTFLKRGKVIVWIIVAIAFVGFHFYKSAQRGGCDWTAMNSVATLQRDGSMKVVETQSYDFHGTCHGGIRQLDRPGSHLADDQLGATNYTLGELTVTESGQPVPIASSYPG